MRRWAIINTVLALLVALLALQIVRTWARVLPPVEPAPRAAGVGLAAEQKPRRSAEKAAARGQQAGPAALVAAIAEKELFDPSRRPPAPEEAREEPPQKDPPPGVSVVGIRILGREAEAFVTEAQGGQQRRVRVGDQISGYTVKAIEASAISLISPSKDTIRMPLALDKPRTPARPAPARAAATNSPAAGPAGTPTAAGVAPAGVTAGVQPPARNPQHQQLPAPVRQKLEQLREKGKSPAAPPGRTQR